MSVYATVQYPARLFKALNAVKLNRDRDCWSTVIFTDTAVVLHVEGSDQSCTATAMLPRKLFSEYSVSDARMEVHLQTLMDTMLLLGPGPLMSNAVAIRLLYGAADGRIMVELTDAAADGLGGGGRGGGMSMAAMAAAAAAAGDGNYGPFGGAGIPGGRRVLQSRILTRPVKDNLLDLRFRDNPLIAQATLQGDALRDVINDLLVAQCAETTLTVNARTMSVQLRGEGSPFGTVDIHIKRSSAALLSVEGPEPAAAAAPAVDEPGEPSVTAAAVLEATTRVSTRHLATACGVRSSGSGGTGGNSGISRGRSAVGGGDAYFSGFGGGGAGGGGGGGASSPSMMMAGGTGSGFERLTLQINAQRQLSVVHMERDPDVKVTVTVVVNSLFDYDLTS